MRSGRGQRGIVLIGVILFLLMGITAVATFMHRVTVDSLMARHRDLGARAEALGRGGVELGLALILQDRLSEASTDFRVETRYEPWSRVSRITVPVPDGGTLHLRIEDAGARLNLNALVDDGQARTELAEVFLSTWLTKVIEEMPQESRRSTPRDPLELARNLIDWIDEDEVGVDGGPESRLYEDRRDRRGGATGLPPNRPLLSVDELRQVEGFDAALVEAMRPYVAVHPLFRADGINLNTAPPWLLASVFHGTPGDFRLADEETIRRILDIREGGGILCAETADDPACTPVREAVDGEIFPPPTFTSDVFFVTAEATYGSVERTVHAVIDRSDPTEPQLRSWRVQ